MKLLSLALASCLLLASVGSEARADGERGTRGESSRYADREAQAPVLADFQGGCMSQELATFFLITAPIWIALLPVILLIWGVTSLCEIKDPAPAKLPPPEEEGHRDQGKSGPSLKAKRSRVGA
jgi:hypothetical protein